MKIQKVTDPAFARYGRVVEGIDFSGLVETLTEKTPVTDEVVYVPSVKELEELPVFETLQTVTYGELPIQIGYCNGKNCLLNALEYHRSSEINIPADDIILLLGAQQDIEEGYTFDTAKVEAFLVPKGTAVEVYATTLHYAPCSVGENHFRVAVVLPKGTNVPLEKKHAQGEDQLITAKNKWLIGHPEGGLDPGVHLGLKGENISVR